MENTFEEEVPIKYLGQFIFTEKTATFRSKTLQLSNVVSIEIKSFKEIKKAVYRISDKHRNQAFKVLAVGVVLAWIGQNISALGTVGAILVVGALGVIVYYYEERGRKKDKVRNFHGLFFEGTSGKSDVLWFDQHYDVARLFDRITNSMNKVEQPSFVANFTDNRIDIRESEHVFINSSISSDGKVVIGSR